MARDCTDLAACIVTGKATVSVLGAWPSGESVELRVPNGSSADALRVELDYRSRPATLGL